MAYGDERERNVSVGVPCVGGCHVGVGVPCVGGFHVGVGAVWVCIKL